MLVKTRPLLLTTDSQFIKKLTPINLKQASFIKQVLSKRKVNK